jgi:electron transport complex protein RnfE
MKGFKIIKNGILNENPIFRMVLGMCPTLAVTTSAENGLGMGLATTFCLVGSNMIISLLRRIIPDKVRIPAYITVIAGFVTIIELILKAFFPALDESLGLFIPLIVVNCIIMARAESFANRNPVWDSILDGIGMGIGFTVSLVLIGSVREILGAGSIFGKSFLTGEMKPILIFLLRRRRNPGFNRPRRKRLLVYSSECGGIGTTFAAPFGGRRLTKRNGA